MSLSSRLVVKVMKFRWLVAVASPIPAHTGWGRDPPRQPYVSLHRRCKDLPVIHVPTAVDVCDAIKYTANIVQCGARSNKLCQFHPRSSFATYIGCKEPQKHEIIIHRPRLKHKHATHSHPLGGKGTTTRLKAQRVVHFSFYGDSSLN
jgi:hypothetical protein